MSAAASTRIEKDLLGKLEVPSDAYYGIQTLRAVQNFRLSGVPLAHYPKLVIALAMVKQAAADANRELGHLSAAKHTAISTACARIIQGEFHDQFVVDMIQGGAGTSTNMNANEVIANIALEAMGFEKGDYKQLHPNNDVNMAQSTNDAYPTAIRLGLLLGHDSLLGALDKLIQSFAAKGLEFGHVLKMGRTQLQDAVPMTLGQEFRAFATTLGEDLARLRSLAPELLTEVNLGGTAIGTGINADPGYQQLAVDRLAAISGQPLVPAADLIEATSDMGAFVLFSGVLKRFAVKLSKLANDLRLLSSGPRTGFGEIHLPSAALFDLGVFAVVLGSLALYTLHRLRAAAAVPTEEKASFVVMGGGSQVVLQMDPRSLSEPGAPEGDLPKPRAAVVIDGPLRTAPSSVAG